MVEVLEELQSIGLHPLPHWLASCLHHLRLDAAFGSLPVKKQAELCLAEFLDADMNVASEGTLPLGVSSLHGEEVRGPHVLQVDEAINIAASSRDRYGDQANTSGCLKLALTDGKQRVFALEYQPIPALRVSMPAGTKIAVSNVLVRRGILLLMPDSVVLLGGKAAYLEEARQRLLEHWRQPPRGKRGRRAEAANSQDPHAAATAAAWPRSTAPPIVDTQSAPVPTAWQQNSLERAPPSNHHRAATSSFGNQAEETHSNQQLRSPADRESVGQGTEHAWRSQASRGPPSGSVADGGAAPMPRTGAHSPAEAHDQGDPPVAAWGVQLGPSAGRAAEAGPSSRSGQGEVAALHDRPHRTSSVPFGRRFEEVIDITSPDRPEPEVVRLVSNSGTSTPPTSRVLTGPPFTYLAHFLHADDASPATRQLPHKARIKCFLVGVKSFHYKGTETYDLHAYVDDGTMICECTIAHTLLVELLGCGPREVEMVLKGEDLEASQQMKDRIQAMQSFLARFEGAVEIHLDERSELPCIIAMEEGGSPNSPTLLLQRFGVSLQLPIVLE